MIKLFRLFSRMMCIPKFIAADSGLKKLAEYVGGISNSKEFLTQIYENSKK